MQKKERLEGLNELILEQIKDGAFPGANYCLVTKDDTFLGTFGKKTLTPEVEENCIDTIYDMASCSKVISTTTCIFKLMEQGKLRLYDSVKLYVEKFRYPNITIWDLMTHSSGLPAGIIRSNKIKTKEEALQKIFDTQLVYEKNTKIVYSDLGYILLGLVVESISKMKLNEFAKKYIFDPLEMYDTTYNPLDIARCAPTEARNDEVVQAMLRGKVHDEVAYILDGVSGHAGLFSTVSDISHFIEMILNDGVYKGKQILSKATIDLMFTPQVRVVNGISIDYNQRGLGWIVRGDFCSAGDLVSEETILHTGFTGTNIFIDRINKVGFSMLTNRVHPTRENVKIIPLRGRIGNYVIANFGGRNLGN